MKLIDRIPYWLKNRYTITSLVFVVWMTFFDQNSIIAHYGYTQELSKLEQDKKYYEEEIKNNAASTSELKNNPAKLEKFAREKYLMKKDNEDIFLIVEEH